MATRTRYPNPWSLLEELEDLQESVSSMLDAPGRPRMSAYPRMNAWVSKDAVVIDVELPGVDPKDVDVSVSGDELTVRGKRVIEDDPKVTFFRREGHYGEFNKTVQLPYRADSQNVKAGYRNGILRVTAPRTAEEKPRRIAIEAA